MARKAKRGKKRKRNPGWFKKGKDPRRRIGFTQEEAKRGYRAAQEAVALDVHKCAWLFRRIRGFYRAKRSEHGQEKDGGVLGGPAPGSGAAGTGRDGIPL